MRDAEEMGADASAAEEARRALRRGPSELPFPRSWDPLPALRGNGSSYKDSITCVIRIVTSSEASVPSDHESRSDNRPSESSAAPEPRREDTERRMPSRPKSLPSVSG